MKKCNYADKLKFMTEVNKTICDLYERDHEFFEEPYSEDNRHGANREEHEYIINLLKDVYEPKESFMESFDNGKVTLTEFLNFLNLFGYTLSISPKHKKIPSRVEVDKEFSATKNPYMEGEVLNIPHFRFCGEACCQHEIIRDAYINEKELRIGDFWYITGFEDEDGNVDIEESLGIDLYHNHIHARDVLVYIGDGYVKLAAALENPVYTFHMSALENERFFKFFKEAYPDAKI